MSDIPRQKVFGTAVGSRNPEGDAVAEARAERKRKKKFEDETDRRPQPPKVFYCDKCQLFYHEVNWFTGEKRNGKCPEHGELKRGKKK
jgi:hypothetical protein